MLPYSFLKKNIPEGFRLYGGEWRYDFTQHRKNAIKSNKSMASFNPEYNVLVVNFLSYSPAPVDEALSRKLIAARFKCLLPIIDKKPLCIVNTNNSVPNKGYCYNVEYYACLTECPSAETMEEMQRIMKEPVLTD